MLRPLLSRSLPINENRRIPSDSRLILSGEPEDRGSSPEGDLLTNSVIRELINLWGEVFIRIDNDTIEIINPAQVKLERVVK
jgi:hypothetical protein